MMVFSEISICRDGLVGYDAALTQLRSWVQFPVFVLFFYLFASSTLQQLVPLLCTTFPHGYSSHSLGLLIQLGSVSDTCCVILFTSSQIITLCTLQSTRNIPEPQISQYEHSHISQCNCHHFPPCFHCCPETLHLFAPLGSSFLLILLCIYAQQLDHIWVSHCLGPLDSVISRDLCH